MSRFVFGLLALPLVSLPLDAGRAPAARAQAAGQSSAKCSTSGLVAWLDTNGNGTAGSTYFTLKLTNLSGRTCTLSGIPAFQQSISAVTNSVALQPGTNPACA